PVSRVGASRHESTLQEPAAKDGVADVRDGLLSYGTTTLDRLAFQKALDDIAASESAGYDFNLKVPTTDFARGVELLADNVLHPALPADAFTTVKQQTAEFLEGEIKSPGYLAEHALKRGLLPIAHPGLREPLPQTVSSLTLDDVRPHHPATFRPDLTTITIIRDIDPAETRRVTQKYIRRWTAQGP